MILIDYSPNNSGGRWWLNDADWQALEGAGWRVHWATLDHVYTNSGGYVRDADGFPVLAPIKGKCIGVKDGRYLGALARGAWKKFETPADAMREFERLTGQDVSDEGCNCCGAPHSFSWDDGYASGSDCINFLFLGAPSSLREAVERLAGEQP